ncbi:hypothetical protein [Nocardia sp. NPDC057440]
MTIPLAALGGAVELLPESREAMRLTGEFLRQAVREPAFVDSPA